MSKTALLAYNAKTEKWEATHNGRVLLKSHSKSYVIERITSGAAVKAAKAGITKIEELSGSQVVTESAVSVPGIYFTVQERFNFLADFTDMVASRTIPSVMVVGSGGMGKSHTVMEALKAAGLVPHLITTVVEPDFDDDGNLKNGAEIEAARVPDNAFVVIKGYSTPKALFRTLYENRDRIVLFDDCDSILKNQTATNILKAALDSYDERVVTWNAEDPFGKSDLPRSFEFTGGVLFISNLDIDQIPQAIRSRSLNCDMSLTRPETIERMRMIVETGHFMSEVVMSIKLEALDFVEQNGMIPEVRALNLRTLIGVVKARLSRPENWERLALYSMVHGG